MLTKEQNYIKADLAKKVQHNAYIVARIVLFCIHKGNGFLCMRYKSIRLYMHSMLAYEDVSYFKLPGPFWAKLCAQAESIRTMNNYSH